MMATRMCEDCVAAMLTAGENDLVSLHTRCVTAFAEKKSKGKAVKPVEVNDPDATEAIKVIFARMLGATHRRIAELFLGKANQATGALLLSKAETRLQLPAGLVDSDAMDDQAHIIASALDWHEGSPDEDDTV